MNAQDVLSGAWGSGGAAVVGAIVVALVRRMLIKQDKENEKRDERLEKLTDAINTFNTTVAVMNTEIKNLGARIDSINKNGCSWGRANLHRHHAED